MKKARRCGLKQKCNKMQGLQPRMGFFSFEVEWWYPKDIPCRLHYYMNIMPLLLAAMQE
ncbi:hypothetical protein CCACVL1_25245 [Corchorus capsularis]|uniref:Uncharacterized protein n=1 Tax=Corchorus capsularis TaxID=210143 RepID=A0A1R3GLL5_COCAP|nr:hypothetical protein CCACVL1_25245 [Corchorus capsularis]